MNYFNQIEKQLKFVECSLSIQSDKEKVWQALQKFGEIASFHDNVVSSDYLTDSELKIGCERYCEFHPQMGMKPVVKEKIIDLKPEESYLIEFYEFKNFPMNHMYIELGIGEQIEAGYMVNAKCWYQSKPKFMTSLFANKMKGTLREILLGYKHFIETGERNKKMKELKKIYSGI